MTNNVDVTALPDVGTLSGRQLRGVACVWCGAPLRPGIDDVDLGHRRREDTGTAWFPRACSSRCGEGDR
ncbi:MULTISPECIES: hypothetical protein [unclassified Streptomyces]|uniref:Uncharacterized protein n=1 Tax=Streptomyces evansiae TaxID=3075535 RepID=A0ABU2R8G9_9ACTN|nr:MULTISPECIES: hypothetical protein [unclassified Streptomyces]MDT0412561.1 hypothetical protein [Streptomyces sp. DSM 41979]WEH26191.1 hypothetical protein P0D76_01995 [Streptomyces sp. AM 3-1-1]SCE32015.1 hypothetical protein GA0115252_141314 [Streptomyces sp. DfronAA-171]